MWSGASTVPTVWQPSPPHLWHKCTPETRAPPPWHCGRGRRDRRAGRPGAAGRKARGRVGYPGCARTLAARPGCTHTLAARCDYAPCAVGLALPQHTGSAQSCWEGGAERTRAGLTLLGLATSPSSHSTSKKPTASLPDGLHMTVARLADVESRNGKKLLSLPVVQRYKLWTVLSLVQGFLAVVPPGLLSWQRSRRQSMPLELWASRAANQTPTPCSV